MDIRNIKSPADIKGLSVAELNDIASRMRDAILKRTAAVGGHVGPNLGSVESIIAMHYVFDAPKDKIVFDVSHQDFVHKMLTGRVEGFTDPASFGKIGEYTDPKESPEYDLFYAGHTSPSLSLCVGLAKARELLGEKHNIVVYIGDGALSGGEAFEGLDAAAALGGNFIVLLDDNQMAIAEDHGGIYEGLRKLRETNGTSDINLFKAFGFDYIYVDEGNDMQACIDVMRRVKDIDHPVVVHLRTQKGEGYAPAEKHREEFHYMAPYDIATGEPVDNDDSLDYSSFTRNYLLEKAKAMPNLLVISSATPEAFGFMAEERKMLGRQYIDVAIAEQTGVSVMAGAARGGAKVVYPVVASFLQRAYDQLVEDWAMDASPAVMLVMSTGICGIPDQTHLGFWDIPMITSIPDIVYLAPANVEEYKAMLDWGLRQDSHKVAIRVPTYSVEHAEGEVDTDYSDINRFKVVHRGKDVAVIAVGDFFVRGKEIAAMLAKKGVDATLINPRFISGVDLDLLKSLEKDHRLVVTLEDGSVEGGFGQRVASALGMSQLKVKNYGLKKQFVDRYRPDDLEKVYGLTSAQISADILASL